jgi:pSer/pThr/pTyr-binding forkhead associated (FHA) protein
VSLSKSLTGTEGALGMVKFYLIIDKGLIGERVFPVETHVTIGRAPENDIHFPDSSVSRRHALIYVEDGKVVLEDLGSPNGTYLNEIRVDKALLSSGDTLRLGKVITWFLQEEELPKRTQMNKTKKVTQSVVSDPETDMNRCVAEIVSKKVEIPHFIQIGGCNNCKVREAYLTKTGTFYEEGHPLHAKCAHMGCVKYGYSMEEPFIEPKEYIRLGTELNSKETLNKARSIIVRFYDFYDSKGNLLPWVVEAISRESV